MDQPGTVEIFDRLNYPKVKRQWYFRLVASNGEILATSEGHANLNDVRKVVRKYFPNWVYRERG